MDRIRVRAGRPGPVGSPARGWLVPAHRASDAGASLFGGDPPGRRRAGKRGPEIGQQGGPPIGMAARLKAGHDRDGEAAVAQQ